MAPADSKDWLFAAVALTSAVTAPATAAPSDQAGVITGVLSSTRATPGGQTNAATVVLGDVVRAGEEFRTGPDGVIHILFLDQSSITIAPSSSLTVEKFSHDPQNRTGKIDLLLSAGSVRVVGGLNSKNNPTQIRTPDATVEILGGITVVEKTPQATRGTYLFGQQMRVTGQSGDTQTVTRPGFSVSSFNGETSSPQLQSVQQLTSLTSRFETAPFSSGSPTAQPGLNNPLISTSDVGSGQPSGSPSAIAGDRLTSNSSALVGNAISNNRPDAITANNDVSRVQSTINSSPNPNPTPVS